MYTQETMLGYSSIKDLVFTAMGLTSKKATYTAFFVSFSMATVDTFITHYMYDSAEAVKFLAFIVLTDFLTGSWYALKTKTFTSKQAPRAFVTLFCYALLITLSWNMAKYSPVWSFLPALLYGGFLGVTFYSIWENFGKLGVVDKDFSNLIKTKLKNSIYKKTTEETTITTTNEETKNK